MALNRAVFSRAQRCGTFRYLENIYYVEQICQPGCQSVSALLPIPNGIQQSKVQTDLGPGYKYVPLTCRIRTCVSSQCQIAWLLPWGQSYNNPRTIYNLYQHLIKTILLIISCLTVVNKDKYQLVCDTFWGIERLTLLKVCLSTTVCNSHQQYLVCPHSGSRYIQSYQH